MHQIKEYIDKKLAEIGRPSLTEDRYTLGVVAVLDDLKKIINYDYMVAAEKINKEYHQKQVDSGIKTLGQIINALEEVNSSLPVFFDFNQSPPDSFSCYRGYYDQLALSWSNSEIITVQRFFEMCHNADGATYSGYKGGEYSMDTSTFVWAADGFGDCSRRKIIGILVESNRVVIKTEVEQY